MPRNSGGTYSLPSGNPVTSGTAISSTWANNTLSDLKTEMTDSLSRSGKGAMLAALPLYSGSVGQPGLTWGVDTDTGLYWISDNKFALAVGGANLCEFAANQFKLSGSAPQVVINESDAAADNKLWDIVATAEDLKFRALTDALVGTDWLKVERTGGTVDKITLAATSIVLTGYTPSGVVTPDGNNTFSGSNTFSGVNTVQSTAPVWDFFESDAAANNGKWRLTATGESFQFQLSNDAVNSFASFMTVQRTAQTIDSVTLVGTTVALTGALTVSNGANITGTVTGTTFSGSGASLTSLPAGNLTGSVADARLSANVALYNAGTANFTGTLQYGGIEVGFRGVPQNSQSANYTCVLSDSGKEILHPSGGGASDVFTIPANASVAYPIGTCIVFTNRDTNNLSIAITTDTMYLAGTTTTGTRTLGQNGQATARKVESTVWIISGSALT